MHPLLSIIIRQLFPESTDNRPFKLTQVNTIQVGAPLLCHIHIHIVEDHRVSEVLSGTGIQHQHGIVSRGAGGVLLVSVDSLPGIHGLAGAEWYSRIGVDHSTRGVRQDGQNFI